MTDHPFRPFADDAAVRAVGEGLLTRTLPRADWTHEAHLAATIWLLRERPDIDVDAEIAAIISGYNASVGGVNDDSQGYHDTITRCFLAGARLHLVGRPAGESLVAAVNALLASPMGRRDWPLRFYSPARLCSVAARRGAIAPDVAALPAADQGREFRAP
ncbi:hypothetical protein ACFOKI_15485 [Sphingomonas qilianensis]|uniref:Uncharacterized protein n=2 Tax=Sphingomonas qilianensis TaxID=1736690 RepID=A0ABU9XM26_9SPHN